MNENEARVAIDQALAKAAGKRNTELSDDVHLVDSEILDSLDASVFLLELEKTSGKKISDQAVEAENLFRVGSLVKWLCR